mmetsp:Transcript_75154/g.220285  ORF Transcript_75154/g.220285 Transcript_75154/m.220285 type:complete len:228 (-) Transcript_75154:1375-2058(-)
MTCERSGMSSPRAITSVVTSSLISPCLKDSMMSRRLSCVLLPCMDSVLNPSFRILLQRLSARSLRPTNTSTLWSSYRSTSRRCAYSNSCFFASRSSQVPSSKTTTSWTTSLLDAGPLPGSLWPCVTTTGEPSELRMLIAKSCTTGDQVVEKKSICRSGLMPAETEPRASSKPHSSILSASSSTKYVTLSRLMARSSISSTSRPGVATTMWQPFFKDAICRALFGPPP